MDDYLKTTPATTSDLYGFFAGGDDLPTYYGDLDQFKRRVRRHLLECADNLRAEVETSIADALEAVDEYDGGKNLVYTWHHPMTVERKVQRATLRP